jgi:energy-coupling factor transporter ATP-binding protein EcfA2
MGVVGERTVAATTYLAITSRLLDKQASLAVKGHSASGKSYAVQAVVGLFPPEAVCIFTGMSERALIYSDEQYTHRTIVLYEAAALREKAEKTDGNQTAYFLRSLLSEGRISYDVTVKKPDGGFTTKKIVKEGPTNLVLTTTQVYLHGENETRMLSITTNDSREQTSRVLAALADETGNHVDVDQWLQLQRWLAAAEHRVTVPTPAA